MDAFLAFKQVGESVLIIGIENNYKILEKARELEIKNRFQNTEFRLGEIEYIPIRVNHLDLLMSNCVINLSTNKAQVYSEFYIVLKPGGRISLSDIVLKENL